MTANAALRQETTMVPGVNVFCPFPSTPKFKRLKEELKRNIRDKRVASFYYTHIRASYNETSGGVKIRGEEREVLWKWKCLCCFFYESRVKSALSKLSTGSDCFLFRCWVRSWCGAHMHVKQKTPPGTKFFRAHNLHKLPLSPLFSTSSLLH